MEEVVMEKGMRCYCWNTKRSCEEIIAFDLTEADVNAYDEGAILCTPKNSQSPQSLSNLSNMDQNLELLPGRKLTILESGVSTPSNHSI